VQILVIESEIFVKDETYVASRVGIVLTAVTETKRTVLYLGNCSLSPMRINSILEELRVLGDLQLQSSMRCVVESGLLAILVKSIIKYCNNNSNTWWKKYCNTNCKFAILFPTK